MGKNLKKNIHVHLKHFAICQRRIHHCKSIILQVKKRQTRSGNCSWAKTNYRSDTAWEDPAANASNFSPGVSNHTPPTKTTLPTLIPSFTSAACTTWSAGHTFWKLTKVRHFNYVCPLWLPWSFPNAGWCGRGLKWPQLFLSAKEGSSLGHTCRCSGNYLCDSVNSEVVKLTPQWKNGFGEF